MCFNKTATTFIILIFEFYLDCDFPQKERNTHLHSIFESKQELEDLGGCPLETIKTKPICTYAFKDHTNFSKNRNQIKVSNTDTKKTRLCPYVGIYEEKQDRVDSQRKTSVFVSPTHILSQVITQPLR